MTKKKGAEQQKSSSKSWALMSAVAGILAATVARKALNAGWKAATGKQPPANPADPDVAMREAVAWAAASGTALALASMYAGRKAAHYYARSTGHLPPELQKDDQRA